MLDTVYLLISGKRIENFVSYSVESDLFVADDAFRLELANPEIKIVEGLQCELYVNDRLELTGIVDRISESYDKAGKKLTLEGRDLLGLLNDTYCEKFEGREKLEFKELVKQLLNPITYINRKEVEYADGNKNKATDKPGRKEEHEFVQIDPGQTVFEVLKNYAVSRGLLFFSMPDGRLVFGEPLKSGQAEYTLVNRKDGRGNNVLKGDRTRNISKRYSKVIVTGQKQGTEASAAAETNVKGLAEDKTFPFYKPFVTTASHDLEDPDKHAGLLMKKQQQESLQLTYRTFGHSQNRKNWQANSICHVDDEVFEIDDDFLITGRTFEMSREGVFTTLKLSQLGGTSGITGLL
jgi:prophage tail gpP-like protein